MSRISPTSGSTTGGTVVTITGTGFSTTLGATTVNFGLGLGTAATDVRCSSTTTCTATSPAGTGTVDVLVTVGSFTSAISPADRFSYTAAPTVTGISPNRGPTAGGTDFTITGTGFSTTSGVTSINFGIGVGTAATIVSCPLTTSCTGKSPARTGTVDVLVTVGGLTSAFSPADRFSYTAAPTVTSVSPNHGSTEGGTEVTIQGTGFSMAPGATSISFGLGVGRSATGVSCSSTTSCTAISPPGLGTVDVQVTVDGSTSAIGPADKFTYTDVPTVTGVDPNRGPTEGGTEVTIQGTGFSMAPGVTSISFGLGVGRSASGVSCSSTMTCTAISPSGIGTVDVQVTVDGSTSLISPADKFTYTDVPTVTRINPNSGSTAGGTRVDIEGTGFAPGETSVSFGRGVGTSATFVDCTSSTSCSATSPAGNGTVDVLVTVGVNTSAITPADKFTYNDAPEIDSISPPRGPSSGGTEVTIGGSNFSPTTLATTVRFGPNLATDVRCDSSTRCTAISPPGSGTVDVRIMVFGLTSAITHADTFTYTDVPEVDSVSPAQGPAAGGTLVTISGSGFSTTPGETTVDFGLNPATNVSCASTTTCTATNPAGNGTVDVLVTVSGQTSTARPDDRFTYVAPTVRSEPLRNAKPGQWSVPGASCHSGRRRAHANHRAGRYHGDTSTRRDQPMSRATVLRDQDRHDLSGPDDRWLA